MAGKSITSRVRHLLTLQQEIDMPDGAGGYARSWEDVADIWGEIALLSGSAGATTRGAGSKIVFGGQIEARLSHRVLLRYNAQITAGMRLLFDGRAFNIHYVGIVDERNAAMELLVEEGVAT